MGGILTQPVTSKCTSQGEGLGLRYGLSSMQGWRAEMEDAHAVEIGLKNGLDDWSFFAVFDGHAGKRAAAFAAWNLLDHILREFDVITDIRPVIEYIEPDLENMSKPISVEEKSQSEDINKSEDMNDEGQASNIPQDPKENRDQLTDSEPENLLENAAQNLPEVDKQPLEPTQKDEDKKNELKKSNDEDDTIQNRDQINAKPEFASFPILKQLDTVENAIKSGFLRIDQVMRTTAQDMSGCTAVCTFISPTHLFFANCGDSRAVLYDGTSPRFVTEDHKPLNPKEKQRIINAGGHASQRINGTLAVSRALGDFDFKKDSQLGPCEQLVSPEPEVTVIERRPQDEFLILACDGIWDVMDNDDLCQYVRFKLMTEPSLEKVCSAVLDLCLHKGSKDNMSIIIVVFEKGPKITKEEQEKEKKNDEILSEMAKTLEFDSESGRNVSYCEFLRCLQLKVDELPDSILPPGAGLESKWDLIKEIYDEFRDVRTPVTFHSMTMRRL